MIVAGDVHSVFGANSLEKEAEVEARDLLRKYGRRAKQMGVWMSFDIS